MTVTKTTANGHEIRCHCTECETAVETQFKPFKMQAWSKKFANETYHCPKCQRPVWGRGRGGFLIWACWSCTMKRAVVDKVIHGQQDKVFGFATNTEGQTVYFHLTRQTIILAEDGSEFPEMYDNSGNSIPPQVGDRILYLELKGEKGLKACWWGLEAEYEAAIETIKARKTYRLMHRRGRRKLSKLDAAPDMRTLWEGKNLAELRHKFGHIRIQEDLYEAYYFEELTGINLAGDEKEWTKIETDPR